MIQWTGLRSNFGGVPTATVRSTVPEVKRASIRIPDEIKGPLDMTLEILESEKTPEKIDSLVTMSCRVLDYCRRLGYCEDQIARYEGEFSKYKKQ